MPHSQHSEPIAVLCVDDDQEFVATLKTFLERQNERLDVTTATNATAGINHLNRTDIDCVVSDYDMPRTDGLEFLRMVRAMQPELPFILFTGKGTEAVAGEAVSAGATDYLTKRTGTEQYAVLADRITAAVARQQAEVSLRRAAERQSTVIESINDAVYRVDSQGRFVSVNEALADMSGYSRSELLDETVSLLKDDATVERFENTIQAMLRNDIDETTLTFDMQTAEGQTVRCEDNLSLLPFENGQYSGAVGSIRDVSTRTRRAQQLERKNDRLDEFASIVSHDLRSPLGIARGRIELVREEHESEHLEDARLALERMDTLIDDLLTLARQDISPTDRRSISIRESVVAAKRMVDEELDVTVEEDVGVIEADESRLQEIFENLLGNVLRHAGPDANVCIGSLERDKGFYVEDDGPGIPRENRDRVFERGFTTGNNGTGLGLAIVKRIVEAHNWEIAITESTTGGARLEVYTA